MIFNRWQGVSYGGAAGRGQVGRCRAMMPHRAARGAGRVRPPEEAEACEVLGQQATKCELTQKNKFSTGEEIEILSPGSLDINKCKVLKITDADGNEMMSCPHASQKITVYIDKKAERGDLFRKGPAQEADKDAAAI